MIRMALHQSSYDLRAFLRNRQSQFSPSPCRSCSW